MLSSRIGYIFKPTRLLITFLTVLPTSQGMVTSWTASVMIMSIRILKNLSIMKWGQKFNFISSCLVHLPQLGARDANHRPG